MTNELGTAQSNTLGTDIDIHPRKLDYEEQREEGRSESELSQSSSSRYFSIPPSNEASVESDNVDSTSIRASSPRDSLCQDSSSVPADSSHSSPSTPIFIAPPLPDDMLASKLGKFEVILAEKKIDLGMFVMMIRTREESKEKKLVIDTIR